MAMKDTKQRGLPIVVEGLCKTYGAQTVLEQVNLEVRSGEFLTLLGPSGLSLIHI